MANFFRKLFLPAMPDYKIFMSGIDAAGKTTILYKLKLGEVVTTIPTIGFNVETLEYKGFQWTAWDVGGCDKIRPLYRHYFPGTNALIYVIDSNDPERLPETLEELERSVIDLIKCNNDTGKASNGNPFACVAIVLNKQDLPTAMSPQSVEERIAPMRERSKRTPGGGSVEWSLNPVCAVSGDGLYEMLDWLNETMAKVEPAAKKAWEKQKVPLRPDQMPPADDLVKRIKEVRDDPEDPDVFMEQFREGMVTPFDHRAHLRAGYLILLRARRKGMRDPKAVDEFINALRNFFTKAGNRLRNTFNITMTVFWCHAVHAALTSYSQKLDHIPSDTSFPDFLLHNSYLMWSGLWTKHYTKDHILNKDAATRFALPDKQPLDSYVVLHDASKMVQKMTDGATPISKGKIAPEVGDSGDRMSDETFWKRFEAGMFDTFGQTDIIRVAYLTVKGARASGERRGLAVKRSMEQLQSLLLRLRVNPELAPNVPVFSHTQFYFWIQMVDATIVDQDVQILNLSFRSLTSLFPQLLQHDLWKEYYSPRVWNLIGARLQFAVPDIKPLPNRFERRDLKAVKNAIERDKRPTIEELKQQGMGMVVELEGYDDEEFLKAVVEGRIPRFTHAVLLRLIWLHIRRVKDNGERRSLGTSKILDGIDDYFTNWTEVEDGDGVGEAWKAHKGLTYVTFWIQMVTGALVGARQVASLKEFGSFLEGAPELVWEPLWTLYYSEEIMESVEGKALFVPPDVRKLPSYII